MMQPPSPPFPPPSSPTSPRNGFSTGAKIAAALLVVAFGGVSVLAYATLRKSQDLEQRLAEQERSSDPQPAEENPADDLLGDRRLGRLFGSNAEVGPDLLRCLIGEGGIGDLLGGGRLFGGDSQGAARRLSPRELVRTTSKQVERLRKLRFKHPVAAEFVTNKELGDRISELLLEEYSPEDARREARVLTALGVVSGDTDMRALRSRALRGQVAGFYVPRTEELVVRKYSGDIGALEKITFAHELDHALTDQNLSLPVEERSEAATADAELAAQALIEGDATLVMQQYALRHVSLEDQMSMLADPRALQRSERQLKSLPFYLQQELSFPYVDGLNFVCELFRRGGWRAVDRAYGRPPASTDQILWPGRYDPKSKPREPDALGRPGPPWSRELRGSFGAAELMWLFGAPGNDVGRSLDDPREAVRAWGGGAFALWSNGDRSAVGISLVERKGEDGLCESVSQWYEATFDDDRPTALRGREQLALDGPRQDAVLRCAGDGVRLGIGPSLTIARTLAG